MDNNQQYPGDIEKQELKIEPIDLMNREKISKLPEMQMGFIDSICIPIYSAFAMLFPEELGGLLDGCVSNRSLWNELARECKETSCAINTKQSPKQNELP